MTLRPDDMASRDGLIPRAVVCRPLRIDTSSNKILSNLKDRKTMGFNILYTKAALEIRHWFYEKCEVQLPKLRNESMLPAAEKPTEMSYAPMGVYVNMPLNKAHLQRRLADKMIEEKLWDGAINCYQLASRYTVEAMGLTTSEEMLQCLKLQQEEYKRLCRYVEIKRAEALREAESSTGNDTEENGEGNDTENKKSKAELVRDRRYKELQNTMGEQQDEIKRLRAMLKDVKKLIEEKSEQINVARKDNERLRQEIYPATSKQAPSTADNEAEESFLPVDVPPPSRPRQLDADQSDNAGLCSGLPVKNPVKVVSKKSKLRPRKVDVLPPLAEDSQNDGEWMELEEVKD